ncbi:MAG: hypothetical protein WCS97_01255 [Candidatus Paceibacterota bacterium]|jgi:hypothetical protein
MLIIKSVAFVLLLASIILTIVNPGGPVGFNFGPVAIFVALVFFLITAGISEIVEARSNPKPPISIENKTKSREALIIISLLVIAGLIAFWIIR